jgi:DNA-binding MarR family transcriptional regulator
MRRSAQETVDELNGLLRVLLEFKSVVPMMPAVGLAIVVYLRLQAEHAANMADVQQLLDISQQRTSLLCRSLARKGLIRLTPNVEDRRAIRIQLAPKGLRLFDKK